MGIFKTGDRNSSGTSVKLGFCKCANVCYAKKCERIYKAYLNKNLTLEKLVQSWTIADWKDILRVYIQNAPKSIKYVRLNEAGDFPSQEMVNIFNELSNWLYGTSILCSSNPNNTCFRESLFTCLLYCGLVFISNKYNTLDSPNSLIPL